MGQSQSKFDSPKKHRTKLKAPLEWRNDAEFEVVSPMSDLSNPSQFRGRQVNHTQSIRRSRTSKVCPKQKPSTGIPAPSRFYFQTVESDTNENIAPDQDTKPTWLKSVQEKCIKAKNQLSDCFIEKEEANADHGKKVGRYEVEETMQEATRKPKKPAHDDYLQFKPVMKESHQHDLTDDVYLQHFMASNSLEESDKDPMPSVMDTTNSTLKGRALSLESSKITYSKEAFKKHSLGSLSNDKTTEASSSNENGIFRPSNQEKHSAPITRTQTSESMRLRASISKTESIDQNDHRRACVGQQVQEQIDQKIAKSTRVQRLRQQYQEEIERLSSGTAKNGLEHDRYAISGITRSSSVPKQHPDENKPIDNEDMVKKQEPKDEKQKKDKPKVKSQRSISVPRSRSDGRPSIDGSALLHLAGLKAPKSNPAQPMPALLKIAGWQSKATGDKPRTVGNHKSKASGKVTKSKTKTSADKQATKSAPDPTQKEQLKEKSDPYRKNSGGKQRVNKKTRFSDPLPFSKPSDNGKTIATILQQAYFGDIRKDDEKLDVSNSFSLPKAEVSKSDSLLFSPSTVASGSPKPSIFDEADANANFLFKADENNIRVLPTKPTSSGSISTLESRSRMNVQFEAAAIPPPASSTIQSGCEDIHRQSRFSNHSKNLNVPNIESKFSDLTESTSGRESSVAMSIPRIDSIPEEEEEEEEENVLLDANEGAQSPAQATIELYRSPEPTVFDENFATANESPESSEETKLKCATEQQPPEPQETIMKVDTEQVSKDVPEDEETPKVPISRWSYRRDGSLSTGVTPMIDGRNHANLVTNSPYLRFQEAKKHFNGGKETKVRPKKKESPVKRKSPSKRATSLVTTRVAAMESKAGFPKYTRRATTGRTTRRNNDKNTSTVPTIQTKYHSLIPVPKEMGVSASATPMSSVISESSAEDEFGVILHSNAIDEDSVAERHSPKVSDGEESDDEFDDILNNGDSDDEDESQAQTSVATLRARFSVASSVTEPASVATTLQRRRLVDAMSVVSSTSSICDTASFASGAYSKVENAIPSAVQRLKGNLPFRDVSSVKPNEQSQGTPLQARKWRAYAAAAREKSLSVRNLNTQ